MATIVIDDRERPRIPILKPVLEGAGHEVIVKREQVSDIHLGNIIGIEVKEDADYAESVKGRLFQQAHELAVHYRHPIIVVLGSIMDCHRASPGVSPSSLLGAATSIMVRTGVPVLFEGDMSLPEIVLSLINKATTKGSNDYTPIRRSASTGEHQTHFLSSLPRIGQTQATRILEHYRTPLNAIKNHERWNEIHGIGDTTVASITRILREEHNAD